jgi:prevent-host-death family protein
MKKRVPAAEARAGMKDLVDAVKERNERIKITRYGKTVAYLVPTKDGEALENCGDELEECRKKRNHNPDSKAANKAGNGKRRSVNRRTAKAKPGARPRQRP